MTTVGVKGLTETEGIIIHGDKFCFLMHVDQWSNCIQSIFLPIMGKNFRFTFKFEVNLRKRYVNVDVTMYSSL